MNELFPDKLWNYKNFKMVEELQIAGEFIYDGISVLNQMNSIDQVSLLFSFLYHVSVGIERLQKIILVLFDNFDLESYKAFEESIITHSHVELNRRICKLTGTTTNTRQNDFLQVLTVFYKSERYYRFNLESHFSEERESVADFIKKYLSSEKIQYHFITRQMQISGDVKELFGRIIGSLAKKYYGLVRKGCAKNNTFSYELLSGSKAERVFFSNYYKQSLQQQMVTEETVLKELLVFLRNTDKNDGLIKFIESIKPLDLDSALLNDYISDICKGIIPQPLIDEVEFQYEENAYSADRLNQISVIGNPNILFDWDLDPDVEE